jgi:hypothetical protein
VGAYLADEVCVSRLLRRGRALPDDGLDYRTHVPRRECLRLLPAAKVVQRRYRGSRVKVAYLAGPYRAATPAGIYDNIHAAREVAAKLWAMGYAVICPHMNTAFFDGKGADHIWLEGDTEFLRRSDVVVVLPGWGNSEGTKAEMQEASLHGIPTFFWNSEQDKIRAYAAEGQ